MSFVNPVLPRFIVKNISTSDVLILDTVKIRPGQELDIYERMEYGERQELTNRILQGLEMPDGSIYVLWKIKKKIEIVSFLNPSYQGSGLNVGSIETKNPYFEGAVLGIDGGQLAWLSPSGGGGSPSGPAGGDLTGSYPNPVLNPTGVDAGTYGNNVTIPSIQVGYDGRIISAIDVPVAFPTTANPIGTAGGDLTGTYPDPEIAAIHGRGVPDIAPSIGQVLQYNGAEWVPGSIPTGGSGGGGVVFFLNNDTAPDSPTTGLAAPVVQELNISPDASQTSVTSSNLSTGGTFDKVAGFVTDTGKPGLSFLPAGIWDFNLWAESSAGLAAQCLIRVSVYKYNGTASTLIATSESVAITEPSAVNQYVASVAVPQVALDTSDRIYVELEATATVPNKTITFYFGNSTPSHTHTSIPSVVGSGIVKVINGVFQSPASPVALNSSDVTGTLPASKGGTGVSSAADGQLLIGNGTGFSLNTLVDGYGITITNGSGSIEIAVSSDVVSSLNGKAEKATRIDAGSGLVGGGDLSANRVIEMPDVGAPGLHGSADSVPMITVDAQGRVTDAIDLFIEISQSQVTDLVGDLSNIQSDLAGKASDATQVIAGSGLEGGGTLAADVTISMPDVGTPGAYGSLSSVPVITTDSKGRVSSVTDTPIQIDESQVSGLSADLAGKVPASLQIIAGSGLDGGGALTSDVTVSMPDVGMAGDYGSASSVPVITTDAQGRVSNVSDTSIQITKSQVTDLVSDLSNIQSDLGDKVSSSRQIIAGDGLSGGGSLAADVTISMPAVGTAGTYGLASSVPVLTTDDQGRVVSAVNTPIQIGKDQVTGLDSTLSSKADNTITITGTNGLTGGGDLTANRTISPVYGNSAGTVAEGNDPRLSDARAPSGPASGDLTGNYPAPTIAAWQSNSISLSSPNIGQVPTWNGTAWVPGSPSTGGSGGGGRVYYLNYDTPAGSPTTGLPADTKQLGLLSDSSITTYTSSTLSTGGTFDLIAGFLTDDLDPDANAIPAGLWDFNIWASSPGAAADTVLFRIKVYKYDGTSTTLLVTTETVYLYVPSVTKQYFFSSVIAQTPLATTDRLYVEIEASSTVVGQTITLSFDGTTPSHTHTTIPSVSGTGLVHVIDGVVQATASPVNLTAAADIIGVLPVANGGTGLASTPTNGQLLIGNGSGFTEAELQAGSGIQINNGPGSIEIANAGVLSVNGSAGDVSGIVEDTRQILAGSGLTGGGDLSADRTISMPNVGTPGVYGSVSNTFVATTDAQGRVSNILDLPIQIAKSQVTGLTADLAGKVSTTTQVIAGTGLSGGGSLASDVTLSLPAVGSSGVYGSASNVPVITTDAQGRVSNATNTPILIAESQVSGLVSDLSGKVPTSRQILAGTGLAGGGDLTADRTISMPAVGSPGTYGSAANIPVLTTDAQGRVSSVVNTPAQIAESQVTGLVSDLSSKVPKTTQVVAGTGLTGGGALTADVTVAMPAVGTAGTYGSASSIPVITTDAQGRVSNAVNTSIAINGNQITSGTVGVAFGGTGLTSAGNSGDLLVSNGTGYTLTPSTSVLQNVFVTVTASEAIARGDVVYVLNANGNQPAVRKAIATTNTSAYSVLGVAWQAIANNTQGLVLTQGVITGLNTQGFVQGAPLYVSATAAGGYTDIKPIDANFPVEFGICVAQSNLNGVIYVRPNYIKPSDLQTTLLPNTQTVFSVSSTVNQIPLSAFRGKVYLPIDTAGGANVTLANASIESPPNTIDYWGKELWLHNVDNNRTITIPFVNNGNIWIEGNVNLVLQPRSMVKFIWTSRGSGGTWVQSCKAIQAG